jgi:hypothetical protein
MTEFKEIATVSGKPGLYKILKPSRSGVILESLDEKKSKMVVGTSQRVSVLSEISIYTLTQEGAAPLEDVMKTIEKEFEGDTGLASDADNDVLPEYDEGRVYASDIKKLINWYKIIRQYEPQVLQDKPAETNEDKAKGPDAKGPDEKGNSKDQGEE